ncbi:hypothetical protein CPAV1605_790 [seawater metagenome]|uniref:Uncharacterized protein n=1 Tax=seawater metagenome TaxID=1561972 RepID=A0A5E8CLM1_9ZZZZ
MESEFIHIMSFINRTHGSIGDKIYTTIDYLEQKAKILAADRSNNFLHTTKLQKMYPNVKNIKASVRDILNEIKLIK